MALTTNGSFNDTQVATFNALLPVGCDTVGALVVVDVIVQTNTVINTPTGWTQMGQGGHETIRQAIFRRTIDGTEGFVGDGTDILAVSLSSGTERWAGNSFCWQPEDWDATKTPEQAGFNGTSANPDPNVRTPSWGALDTYWVVIAHYEKSAFVNSITAYPTNYDDNQIDAGGELTSGVGVGSAVQRLTVETEDPGAFTLQNSSRWVARVLNVAAAAAGGTEGGGGPSGAPWRGGDEIPWRERIDRGRRYRNEGGIIKYPPG